MVIPLTAVSAFFKSWKLWVSIAGIIIVTLACWNAYVSLKESIRADIYSAIDAKKDSFKSETQVIHNNMITQNDEELDKLRQSDAKNADKLYRKLLDLEQQVKKGSITEPERREIASLIRYKDLIIRYCQGQSDENNCLLKLGVPKE